MIKTLSITLVALAWCSISFGQNQGQPAQGTPAQGQVGGDVAAPPKLAGSLTLNTKNTRYSGDEHIFLNIDLQNKGSVLFKFSESDVYVFYKIEVVGPDDKKLPMRGRDISLGGEPWGVRPGKIRKAYIALDRLFDLSHVGKYTVKVSKKISQDDESITLTSEPLSFEITSEPTLGGWQS